MDETGRKRHYAKIGGLVAAALITNYFHRDMHPSYKELQDRQQTEPKRIIDAKENFEGTAIPYRTLQNLPESGHYENNHDG